MSRRAKLWVAFAGVHVVVAVLGFLWWSEPMGDVYKVYGPWSACALGLDVADFPCPAGHQIVGITESWVYPFPALLPMLATWLFAWPFGLTLVGWSTAYTIGWALLVTVLDALAFWMLVGDARSQSRVTAARFWLGFSLLLGPIGMYRLDGLTVPIALVGCLWLVRRPWVGSALLAAAVWMKVWPAAILAAAVVALRRRVPVIGASLAVSAAVLAVVVLAGGAPYALGFVSGQTDRSLQVEAPVSMWWLWRTVMHLGDRIVYSEELATFQMVGPGVDATSKIMTPLLVLCLVAVAVIGAWKMWRGASFLAVFPALSLSLVLVFMVVNKVGSPQYQSWLVVPLAMGMLLDRARWRNLAGVALGIALLTHAVYPVLYFNILYDLNPFSALVLTVRNILLVVLLVMTVRVLLEARPRSQTPRSAPPAAIPAVRS